MQVDLQMIELDARLAWAATPALRAEFGDNEATFLAWRRAEARGQVRTFGAGKVVVGEHERRLTLDGAAVHTGSIVTLSGARRGHVSGYGAVFGGVNRKGIRLMAGAFRESLARVPLPMLWGHDQDKPIGRWDALSEDSRGLFADGQINLDVAAGREAFALLSGQDVTGLSVGFKARRGGVKLVDDVLEFSAVDLFEISLAPVPAEDRARVTAVQGA